MTVQKKESNKEKFTAKSADDRVAKNVVENLHREKKKNSGQRNARFLNRFLGK